MEKVSVQIPAALYMSLYEQFQETTSTVIIDWLTEKAQATGGPHQEPGEGRVRYPQPRPGTKTGRVWEIADRILKETGQASREAVIRACMEEGLNVNTASTQYSYWNSSQR